MASCTSGVKSCTPIDSRLNPSVAQQRELFDRRHARIDLDGDFRAGLDVEVPDDRSCSAAICVEA